MGIILHVTTRGQWEQALAAGEYRSASFAEEGFLHCCTHQQLAGVLERYFTPPPAGLITLEIDATRVRAEIRWEGAAGPFPHIYGPLNPDAVMEVKAADARIGSC